MFYLFSGMFTTSDGLGWLFKFTGVVGFIYVLAIGFRGKCTIINIKWLFI